jgi:hypothetical protein
VRRHPIGTASLDGYSLDAAESCGIRPIPQFIWKVSLVCYNPGSLIVIPDLRNSGGAMSGPIVRKYGFPNHEQIFGSRPLEHGADDAAKTEAEGEKKADDKPKAQGESKPKK